MSLAIVGFFSMSNNSARDDEAVYYGKFRAEWSPIQSVIT